MKRSHGEARISSDTVFPEYFLIFLVFPKTLWSIGKLSLLCSVQIPGAQTNYAELNGCF